MLPLSLALVLSLTQPKPAPPATPFEFATSAVEAMSLVADAQHRLVMRVPQPESQVEASFENMVAIKQAISRVRDARVVILPYKKSTDALIAEAASDLGVVFDALAVGLLKSLRLEEQTLAAKSMEDLKALVAPASDNAVLMEEAWKGLPVAVASVSHALVNPVPDTNGRHSRLRIGREDARALMDQLKMAFPATQPPSMLATQVAPRLMMEFLDQPWR